MNGFTTETSTFGKLHDGREVTRYHLSNQNGMQISVMDYGATLISVKTPDQQGNISELTLGFDKLDDYLAGHPYLGSTVGRVANRTGRGQFKCNGQSYQLNCNDDSGQHHLHGGIKGFDKVLWKGELLEHDHAVAVAFEYTSPDGEENYPGNLTVCVTYWLKQDNSLHIEYWAKSDADTPVNLTNHAYWHLEGAGNGDIYEHELQIFGGQYVVTDNNHIPTGEMRSVHNTPLDFIMSHKIGERINAVSPGYDTCYILASDDALRFAAMVIAPNNGRMMCVYTTYPALQFYTANNLTLTKGADGISFDKHHAFCLETQNFPDAMNHENFPSTLLQAGEIYQHKTVYEFVVKSS